MNDDEFALTNEPPRPATLRIENDERRQRPLFGGGDCLPGQDDLFATDGEADDV